MRWEIYVLLFFIYSFLGWCLEMVCCNFGKDKIVNRGFLIGPICPIYGHGCLLMIFLLHKYLEDPIALFVMAVVLCSILEYVTSYLMEKIFKARWWDYSDKKYNLNGRICLLNSLAFGFLGLLIMYVVNPFLVSFLDRFSRTVLIVISSIIFVIYLVDNIVSFSIISGFKKVCMSINKDNTEEITRRVRKILSDKGLLYNRLVSAFDFKTSEMFLMFKEQFESKMDKKNKKKGK